MRDEAEIRDELARISRLIDRIEEMTKSQECTNPVAGVQLVQCIESICVIRAILSWVMGDDTRHLHLAIDQMERLAKECTT